MIIVCSGSRHWNDAATVRLVLGKLPKTIRLVVGDERGRDRIAQQVTKELGLAHDVALADCTGLGPGAGPVRYSEMPEQYGAVDLLVTLHDFIAHSKGTSHHSVR